MQKRRNPGAGQLQGFGINAVCDKPIHTAAYLDLQPNIDVVALLARRTGVAASSIAAQMLAWGLEVRS